MPGGRPSTYNPEIAASICERLSEGESMRAICESEDYPNRSTVLRWMGDNTEFAARCARARELQADLMDDLILDVARGCTEENYQSSKVKLSAYQWRASKLAPKKYGDKTIHSGDPESPLAFTVRSILEEPEKGK